MNFFVEFFLALVRQPSFALQALYWRLTQRKVRARNLLRRVTAGSPYAYRAWIKTRERNGEALALGRERAAGESSHPRFSIVLCIDAALPVLYSAQSVRSILNQYYPYWELIIISETGVAMPELCNEPRVTFLTTHGATISDMVRHGLMAAFGDFVLVLPRGSRLPPTALRRYADALKTASDSVVLYGDHDEIDHRGRRLNPWFKSRWNGEMFLAQDYISPACVIERNRVQILLPHVASMGEAFVYELLLQVCRGASRVTHVPHILAHVRQAATQGNAPERADIVNRHLRSRGALARVGAFGTVQVSWPLPRNLPCVSIIIPTRDKPELLRACVSSLLEKTSYSKFEVIIVNNGSVDSEALQYLEAIAKDARVRVLPFDHPYNFSAINNFAVSFAAGDFICMLNNDTEVSDGNWLTEMMRYAIRSSVGAVGAKLLYPDKSIQHAGVTIGLGEAAGHAHRLLPSDQPGYFCRAHVPHFVSAVTAACLVVAKSKYEAVGGFDEADFKVAFNDVDFCLKLEKLGWRNVYAPQAVLFHHESKSRGQDNSPKNIDRYRRELAVLQRRWGTMTYDDPLHNPNLDKASESYVILL